MTDITIIVGAVLTLISAIITAVIIPYVKSRTTETQQATIQAVIDTAVYAAEQTLSGTGRGAEKKAAVREYLRQRGITYDEAAIDVMIEAAVKKLTIAEG